MTRRNLEGDTGRFALPAENGEELNEMKVKRITLLVVEDGYTPRTFTE